MGIFRVVKIGLHLTKSVININFSTSSWASETFKVGGGDMDKEVIHTNMVNGIKCDEYKTNLGALDIRTFLSLLWFWCFNSCQSRLHLYHFCNVSYGASNMPKFYP